MTGERFHFLETGEADAGLLFLSKQQDQVRIGCLRGDFGRGDEFHTSWIARHTDLKTPEFRGELDDLVNTLRENGPLKDLASMRAFCAGRPQAKMSEARGFYAFRIDTDRHRYYLRFFPNKGDNQFYIFCYRTDQLVAGRPEPRYSLVYGPNADKRMEAAKRRTTRER